MNFLNLFDNLFFNKKETNDKKNTKIIVFTGPIGVGKTKLANFLNEYLIGGGKKVFFDIEITMKIEKELKMYYQFLEKGVKDQGISFWFQDKLIDEYKKFYNNIDYEKYDYVIFDRTHLDTNFFTIATINKDPYIEICLPYLKEKLDEISFRVKPDVINVSVDKEISIERILKRDRDIEQKVDIDYYELIYDMYDNIDEIYEFYYLFNNSDELDDNLLKKKIIGFFNHYIN
ncbi:8824_t:CDS:1 [Cetraspora pellucida]|uniref:8824_t:CDS:1 n=1 Tax=Cetraspora pellucida TaxID=1433469 RepID=A0A9N8VFL1_9GLOM|nr:8824_t:CDS:1 [Cetraspora pellucida]